MEKGRNAALSSKALDRRLRGDDGGAG